MLQEPMNGLRPEKPFTRPASNLTVTASRPWSAAKVAPGSVVRRKVPVSKAADTGGASGTQQQPA
jgi:hypothetical protein